MENTTFDQGRWRDVAPAALVLALSVLGILLLVCQPTKGQRQLAVLVPLWDNAADAAALVGAAGGTLVDGGGLPEIFIAASDRPGFAHALYRAGAWFVMNPIGAHGCLAIHPKNGTSP